MPPPPSESISKKRKTTIEASKTAHPMKKPCVEDAPQNISPIGPHDSIIADLSPKRDVLCVSTLSSSQIRKRITLVTSHLLSEDAATSRTRLVLLHARPPAVCKMMTVVEQCKRLLSDGGKAWYQYNQLYELPEKTVEPAKEDSQDDDDDDAFEPMQSRFENAVLPPPRARTRQSLRIFLSLEPVAEIKSRPDVTTQSSEEE